MSPLQIVAVILIGIVALCLAAKAKVDRTLAKFHEQERRDGHE